MILLLLNHILQLKKPDLEVGPFHFYLLIVTKSKLPQKQLTYFILKSDTTVQLYTVFLPRPENKAVVKKI